MAVQVKTDSEASKAPKTKTVANKGTWAWIKSWIKSWFDWTGEHKTATVFFIFTILSTIVTGIAFNKSQSTFKKSQNRIVENQTKQIEDIEALIKSMHLNAKSAFTSNEIAIQKLISDSLLAKIPKLNNLQQAVLNKYIKAIVVTSASELAYKDWMKELNATLSQKEISQIQMESKTLLDLEFDKIQNEYESLTLWAGILTVVFLIFSFYSLFKTDDLVKQGQEGVDRLYAIQEKGDRLIIDTNKDLEELKSETTKNLESQKMIVEHSISELKKKTAEELKQQHILIENTQLQIDKSVEEKSKLFQKITEEFQQRLDKEFIVQQVKLNKEFESYRKKWDDLLADLSEYSESPVAKEASDLLNEDQK